jgi:putative flavoprotein involved in K+ transport
MRLDVGKPPYPTFGQFVAALEAYRAEHAIDVVTGAEVTQIERTPDGFAVHARVGAEQRVLAASHVINATGIVSAPKLPPDFDRAKSRLSWIHSLDVRADRLSASEQLLVVGGGASAAEVLTIWLRVHRPGARAWISLRSPLRAIPSRILGLDVHYLSWLPEHLPARPIGPWVAPKDGMFGHAIPRAIRAGAIERVPSVARYEPSAVVLTPASSTASSTAIPGASRSLEPDLLVFATGFVHPTGHLGDLVDRDVDGWPLARRCESTRTPRLYLLGTRFVRTLASPYVRGIARDAAFVARRIARDH